MKAVEEMVAKHEQELADEGRRRVAAPGSALSAAIGPIAPVRRRTATSVRRTVTL